MIPLLIFPARASIPTEEICTNVANVYHVALRVSSWGLSLPVLELPQHLGGHLLPQPRTYL